MTTYRVGYLIGSLAKASINRKLARALVSLAPAALEMAEISFSDLPLYSYDYDADFPPVAKAFSTHATAHAAGCHRQPQRKPRSSLNWTAYGMNAAVKLG